VKLESMLQLKKEGKLDLGKVSRKDLLKDVFYSQLVIL